ncbi:mitochondrial ornithine transporter 1 [Onthophagus taurus]|uniref:mitochondrial ornithine transporter 1 n=1 Tax=Onthophagus taurus TaxID=166361 RepID=UPI000C2074D1|nr:mitochondrial ornithine transporter 1 [Onthophagus taurus]
MLTEATTVVDQASHTKDAIIDFTAGSLGGIALVYVGQPLDTIKVKMQTFPGQYNTMIKCFKQTLAVDGVYSGLYAGTVPALAANVAENSVLFLGYGFCQKFMQKVTGAESIESLSTISNASAGCLAAFFSSLVLCPTELVKCKLQAMHEVNNQEGITMKRVGPVDLVGKILKTEGIKGMFKGLVATLAREMPGYFVFFGGYEGTRALLTRPGQKKDDIGVGRTMIAGAIGGLIFWTVTYPADVVKSRVQISKKTATKGLVGMLYQIGRNEGVRALYSGLTPTLVRTVPATAVLFLTYEYSKKVLHQIF